VPDLKRLDRGARLHGCLLVVEVDHRSYGNGKDCVVLTLGNAYGSWADERPTGAGAIGGWSRATSGNENGRLVVARRPSHDWTNQGRGITATVLLPPATG
jgi:hypothetical protein